MRKLIDRLLNKPEPANETIDESLQEQVPTVSPVRETLESMSDSVEEIAGGEGQVFHIKEGGASIDKIADEIGHVPWSALTNVGSWLIAMPGPVAMATLLMTVNHDNSLCQEVNALLAACEKLSSNEKPDTAFSVLVNEVSQIYAISGHKSNGVGTFGFREEPTGVDSMVYGMLSPKQVVEMAVAITRMAAARPDFQSEGLNRLIEATERYWSDLMTQVGPVAVMETMGEGYEGKA